MRTLFDTSATLKVSTSVLVQPTATAAAANLAANLGARGLVLDDALARERAVGVITPKTPPVPVTPPPPTPADIPQDSALGRTRETSAVAKRLEVAPSVEFVNIARQTKERFFLGGLQLLARVGYALEDVPVSGFALEQSTVNAAGATVVEHLPIEDAADLLALTTGNLAARIVSDADAGALAAADQTEGRLFAQGLDSVDATVRFLRQIETRTDDYRRLLARTQAARSRLQTALARLNGEIAGIDSALAEVRHDLGVARSLRAEEEQRVARLVERRKAVLAERVPYLVFRRPLHTRTLDNAPVRDVDPALVDDPVPAARAQTDELLPELQQMVDTLRDVPARWFRKAAPLFERFDRAQSIERLHNAAADRLQALVAKGGLAIGFASDGSAAANRLRQTFDGHSERIVRQAQQALTLQQTGKLLAGSARQALDGLRQIVSMADLLRAAPPVRGLSLSAAGLLDDIGNVAQSLYERCSNVPPATRLRWAELLSELDPAVPLRQLSVLPDFGNEALGVDSIAWRQMQRLVDWLFLQIDADEQAVAAINDLVRVAVLLSAHAPVRRIVSARLRRPVPAQVDARLELALDPGIARIGMQVLVHAPSGSQVIARAVLEDIASFGGVARITEVLVATAHTLDDSHRVQLQSGPPLSTAAKAQAERASTASQQVAAQTTGPMATFADAGPGSTRGGLAVRFARR